MKLEFNDRFFIWPIATFFFLFSLVLNFVFWNSDLSDSFNDDFLRLGLFFTLSLSIIMGMMSFIVGRFSFWPIKKSDKTIWKIMSVMLLGQSLGAIVSGLLLLNLQCIYHGFLVFSVAIGLYFGLKTNRNNH